jgi:hypothetical protein
MPITGVSLTETTEYVSQHDSVKTKEEGATVFVLGAIDADIRLKLTDSLVTMVHNGAGGMGIQTNRNTVNLSAVRYGLKGWSNLKDKTGKDIAIKFDKEAHGQKLYDVVAQESLNALPNHIIKELGMKILEVNSVNATLEGNLEQA